MREQTAKLIKKWEERLKYIRNMKDATPEKHASLHLVFKTREMELANCINQLARLLY